MGVFSMASHGYPSGLGTMILPEQSYGSGSKDFHHVLPFPGSNQDLINSHAFDLSYQQNEEWKTAGGLFNSDQFVRINPTSKRHIPVIDVQGNCPELGHFSSSITERLTRQEKILKLLASGSIELESGLVDLSMLDDFMGPTYQSLIYPTGEFHLNEPFLDLMGDRCVCSENPHHPECKVQYDFMATGMHDVLSTMSGFYTSSNAVKSNDKSMVVPYFEWRKRARINTDALATEKLGSTKSHEKTKEKTSQKKKINTKTTRERDIYGNTYLHAMESLLSIIVDRKQQGKNAIQSLKKSGSHLPQLLTQFSASIAGTGVVLVLSVISRVAFSRVPFCAAKFWSTGLGLGLVWLSWSVNKLRNTVICIGKTSGNEMEDEMVNNLDRNLKDIYFRAAALMAITVLRMG